MTEQNIKKVISYLNTQLSKEAPGKFAYIKHKTAPTGIYGTVEILNENENNDNVFETDLLSITFFSPESNGPFGLSVVLDKFKTIFYGANIHLDGFITRNIDQLGRLDLINSRGYYETTLTVNVTYSK